MTVIQTVAGGAGGSGGAVIDLSNDNNEVIRNISWSSSSGTKIIAQSEYDYNSKTVNVDAGDGLICKTQMGYVGYSQTHTHIKGLSSLISEIQTILNRSDSGVPNLPDGSYTLYLGKDRRSGSCAYIVQNSGTGTCKFGEVRITVSNGNVTVVSTQGNVMAGGGANSVFRIAIYGIVKTARCYEPASERSERAG